MQQYHAPSPFEPHGQQGMLHAIKWSILGEASSRLIAPVVLLILARLLAPEDFGVVAAATVVISLCQTLADAGMGKALIQSRKSLEASFNAAFWLSLGISLALSIVIFIAAPAISAFFDDARITYVTRLLAIQVPLTGLAAVPTALLQRDLAFRELFLVRLLTAGLPALASIPMALLGYGYWSLVAATVIGQFIQCTVLWFRCHWRPSWKLDGLATIQLARFGRWSAASGALTWCYGWADSLFVAHWLGTRDMGIYRVSATIANMSFGLVLTPLLPVLYSLYSRKRSASFEAGNAMLVTARGITFLSLPLAGWLALAAPIIQTKGLGSDWEGLAPVLALLAIGQGVAWLVGANGEAYRAAGRPDLEFMTMALSLAAYLVGYSVSIENGIIAFAGTRTALSLVGVALHILVANRHFGTSIRSWLVVLAKPLLFTAIAGATALATDMAMEISRPRLIAAIIFPFVYMILAMTFDRRYIFSIMGRLHGT